METQVPREQRFPQRCTQLWAVWAQVVDDVGSDHLHLTALPPGPNEGPQAWQPLPGALCVTEPQSFMQSGMFCQIKFTEPWT